MTGGTPARARTATLVTVGPPDRLAQAIDVLASVDQAGSLRHVLLATAAASLPSASALQDVTVIEQIRPQYLNNAIAAHRLSSLPTVIWWLGGPPGDLDGAAALADRLILDVDDPFALWPRVPPLFGRTAVTDIRWARLTPWRAAMAQMFDVPRVREGFPGFERLSLAGSDPGQCALFGGWLDAALNWDGRVRFDVRNGAAQPLAAVELVGPSVELRLTLLSNGVCLSTEARDGGQVLASRVVSLGNLQPSAVLSEELRIRSRDVAFERALERSHKIPPA